MRQKNFIGRLVATVLVAVALVFVSASPIASAAKIVFNITDVTISRGNAKITGHFFNDSNSSGTVTAIRFQGRIDNVSVDRTFQLNLKVPANSAPLHAFTISDGRISPKSSGPKSTSNLKVVVSSR